MRNVSTWEAGYDIAVLHDAFEVDVMRCEVHGRVGVDRPSKSFICFTSFQNLAVTKRARHLEAWYEVSGKEWPFS